MLRLSGGFGVARVSHPASSEGQPEREYRDVSMMLEVSLGGSVARNWLLHGTVTGFELRQPRVYEDGIDVGRPRRTLRVASLGTGLTRYLGPSNVYLHGGLGVGFVRLTGGEDSSWRSNPGLVLLAALGKEWWVGRGRWGLGCALRGEVVRVSAEVEEGISTPVQALLLGLAFSATLD